LRSLLIAGRHLVFFALAKKHAFYIEVFLSEPHSVLVRRRHGTPRCRQKKNCIQQISLAAAVLSDQDVHFWRKSDPRFSVIPVVVQLERFQLHRVFTSKVLRMFVRGLISQFKIRNMSTTTKEKNPSKGKAAATENKGKSSKIEFTKENYLYWYESMQLIRRFEEKSGQLYGMQKIKGFCHLYIGQEACVSGAVTALTKDDKWITAYRDHGHPLALGTDPKAVMAELYGKETGISRGKGGSMHLFDKENNFFGGHGIVGGQIPVGAGIAFAEKYKKTKNLCMCYMGDGAVRQGAFHETLNYAMLWKLPVIFVIENNGYAMGTSVQRSSNVTELYRLGESYDIPSEPVDGMSCEAVHIAVAKAAERARNG